MGSRLTAAHRVSPPGSTADRAAAFVRRRYYPINRLMVRVVEASTAVELGGPRRGWLLAAAAGWMAVDLATAALLRRRPNLWLAPRVLLDAIDVAAWTVALGPAPDLPPQAAAPLALEAGLRLGLRGLVVSAAIGGTTSAALLAAGRRPELAPWLWPVVGTVCGALVIRYLRHQLLRGIRAAREEIEASAGRAELAGQNSIALGADTVVDLLARTAPLLAVGDAPPPRSPLAAWKQRLAEASSHQATYLGVALARWERRWNARSPDLRRDVEVRCQGAAGTLLLSPGQGRWLGRALSAMRLRGPVTVEALRTGLPGREQRLLVNGRPLVVPADPSPPPVALDPGPIAFVLAGVGCLSHSLPGFEAVPPSVTVPLAALALAGAWWSHRHLQRVGQSGRPVVLGAALALGVCDAVMSTVFMRSPVGEGLTRAPFLLFTVWGAPLFLLYEADLTRRQRGLVLAVAAGVVALGFATLRSPMPPLQVATVPVWQISAIVASLGLRDLLVGDAAAANRWLEADRRTAVESAYRRGRRLVIETVRSAADECRRTYRAVGPRLEPDLSAEVAARLEEAEARLDALRAGEAAPVAPPEGAAGTRSPARPYRL